MTHCHTSNNIKERPTTPVSDWVKYKPLILTHSAPSAQSLHWLPRKQKVGQCSLAASVADIDAVKAATAATRRGKRIVGEDMIPLWTQIKSRGNWEDASTC